MGTEEKKDKTAGDGGTGKKDAPGGKMAGSKGKKDDKVEEELSDEDLELKNKLELMVTRVSDADAEVAKLALETLRKEILTATASMTSVPKPLKFLRSHAEPMKKTFDSMAEGPNRHALADVISILSTTLESEGQRDALKYRLLGSAEDATTWGHEYIRHLAGELATEFSERQAEQASTDDLLALVRQFVPYHMTHNAEPEAVDLLLEVEQLPLIENYIDDNNFGRTCLYLTSCCKYLPEPEDMLVLRTAYNIYTKMGKPLDAMRVALQLNERELIETTFSGCTEASQRKQLAYLLAAQGVSLNLEEGPCAIEDDDLRETLTEIISSSQLHEHFLALARDLDVMEPKVPDDVYKMHLVEGRAPSGPTHDSARANLAATFVNAFVNAGFGQDKLVTPSAESGTTHWIYKNKDHGQMSATASLGMVTMWDVEGGLPAIDKYLYSSQNQVVAGAMLAVGVVNCHVQHENDPAFALLYEAVNKEDTSIRLGAVMGLGLAYAGTEREEVLDLLTPLVTDSDTSMEVAAFAAMSLGLVYTSTTNEDCVQAILQALMTRPEMQLGSPFAKLLCLGLGLLFLGKQDVVEATLEVVKTVDERISKYCQTLLEVLAYAGTGDVLKVQGLLAAAGEHIEAPEDEPWRVAHQMPAVLGIGLIAQGEELGAGMAGRALEHLLQYGDAPVRRAVPLALAALHVGNPEMSVMDTLSRLSHDASPEVAMNATLALGIIGAGTNNARLAGMLRQLSSYYYKEPTMLFLVHIAQGLTHMGKGLITINPVHTDGQLLSGVSLAGLLGVLTAAFDMKATLVKDYHFMLYYLATAMRPRMLMTLDEDGKMLPVAVRVGQAVDTVAQAGKPKQITGFQTHTTPVLLNVGERAELATDKYLALTPVLEGCVILKENPDYVDVEDN